MNATPRYLSTYSPCLDGDVFAELLALSVRRPEFLGQVVSRFVEHALNALADIEHALEAHDLRQASFAAHTLKGSARQLGATRVADLCEEMVQRCEQRRYAAALRLVPRLRRAHADTVTELLAHDTQLH